MKPVLVFLLLGIIPAAAQPAPAVTPVAPLAPPAVVPQASRFREFFAPFRTDRAALSPDGKWLAYTVREGEKLSVVIVDAEQPSQIKTAVVVADDDSSTAMLVEGQREKTPARVKWMQWVTPTRLAVETNRAFTGTTGAEGTWQSWEGAVFAFNADGSDARMIAQPSDLPESVLNPATTDRRFSVKRDKSPIIWGTWNASMPVGSETGNATTAAMNALSDLAAPTSPDDDPESQAPAAATASQPRHLRVFGLDPQHPGAIRLVVTGASGLTGSHRLGLYSLNALDGKITQLNEDMVDDDREALLDRQGRIRLTLSNTHLSKFPLPYAYRGPKGAGGDRPLDQTPGAQGFTVSPENYFGARSIPLGFDENSELLYYASNTGRDTFGIYSLNLATGQRGSLALENPAFDLISAPRSAFSLSSSLVFDPHTHALAGVRYENAMASTVWLRPELRELQSYFEQAFRGRSVELAGWDRDVGRSIVAAEGPGDAGAFYLFDRTKKQLLEFARRAPWIDAEHTHATLPFSYPAEGGYRISGLVTVPRQPRQKPIPMVLLCPTWPWERVRSDFSTEVQALADMGFAVVQLNGRGVWGLGLKHRQSLTAGYDRVQVDDLAAAVDQLVKAFAVNPKRISLLGFGHGGFIALRALQDYPEKFRCAIAIDAPVDLAAWLGQQHWENDAIQATLTRAWLGDEARLKAAPLVREPQRVTKPALLLNYPGPDGAPFTSAYLKAKAFASDARRGGAEVQFENLSTDYMRGLPRARAAVFGQIETFLNLNIYSYDVKLHDAEVVEPDPASAPAKK